MHATSRHRRCHSKPTSTEKNLQRDEFSVVSQFGRQLQKVEAVGVLAKNANKENGQKKVRIGVAFYTFNI